MGESSTARYNLRSPSVKRLMQEAKELNKPTELYHAQPLEDNLYEWHFTIRGSADTEFANGVYHGRIMLPNDYPMKPPSIVLLTPNGRFEINKKICLSISGHHPESWQPSWSIRTAMMAIIGFLPTPGKGAIGALDYPPEERRKLARRSRNWKCPACGVENERLLLEPDTLKDDDPILREVKNLAKQISFKGDITEKSKEILVATAPIGGPAAEDMAESLSDDAPKTPPPAALTPAFQGDPPLELADTSDSASSEATGLRLRASTRDDSDRTADASTTAQSADEVITLEPRAQAASSSLYLMILVSVAIGVLLLRRLFKHFDSISNLI